MDDQDSLIPAEPAEPDLAEEQLVAALDALRAAVRIPAQNAASNMPMTRIKGTVALRRVLAAAADAVADEVLLAQVQAAHAGGHSLRAIAPAHGLSHTQVGRLYSDRLR
jgi:hypothetical protein